MNPGIITLTTDFGTEDSYVGVMKGVILTIKPDATIIDISHEIRPRAILRAAIMIRDAYRFFPENTVHIVVVDPGVGSERRPVLVMANGHFFVGPDNGTFQPIIRTDPKCKIIHLTNDRYFLPKPSSTFHGRDIFAPVAAHLLSGVVPVDMGQTMQDPKNLEAPSVRQERESLHGQIVHVDHFGNLITNIHSSDLSCFKRMEDLVIEMGDLSIRGIRRTYSDVPKGDFLALMGSSNFLEIAVNSGRASGKFKLDSGNGEKVALPVEIYSSITPESST